MLFLCKHRVSQRWRCVLWNRSWPSAGQSRWCSDQTSHCTKYALLCACVVHDDLNFECVCRCMGDGHSAGKSTSWRLWGPRPPSRMRCTLAALGTAAPPSLKSAGARFHTYCCFRASFYASFVCYYRKGREGASILPENNQLSASKYHSHSDGAEVL